MFAFFQDITLFIIEVVNIVKMGLWNWSNWGGAYYRIDNNHNNNKYSQENGILYQSRRDAELSIF